MEILLFLYVHNGRIVHLKGDWLVEEGQMVHLKVPVRRHKVQGQWEEASYQAPEG